MNDLSSSDSPSAPLATSDRRTHRTSNAEHQQGRSRMRPRGMDSRWLGLLPTEQHHRAGSTSISTAEIDQQQQQHLEMSQSWWPRTPSPDGAPNLTTGEVSNAASPHARQRQSSWQRDATYADLRMFRAAFVMGDLVQQQVQHQQPERRPSSTGQGLGRRTSRRMSPESGPSFPHFSPASPQ